MPSGLKRRHSDLNGALLAEESARDVKRKSRCLRRAFSQTWQDFLAIELDHSSLIVLARVYVDASRAAVKQVRENFHVSFGVGPHCPSFSHLL